VHLPTTTHRFVAVLLLVLAAVVHRDPNSAAVVVVALARPLGITAVSHFTRNLLQIRSSVAVVVPTQLRLPIHFHLPPPPHHCREGRV
jgi:hypothetical protein